MSNKLQCHLVIDLIKHFCYLIRVERQKETITVFISADVTDDTIETIRTTHVSAIFRKFGNCFGLFDIAGKTQYAYIVVKYKN